MSRIKLDIFTSNKTRFIAEQIGLPENEFKESIVALFLYRKRVLRAYLVQVQYGVQKLSNVALCLAIANGEDETLANDIALVFHRMFGKHEHLDILFLNENQERQLRKVCCPFFSSKRFKYPDFYLTSSEGYGLEEIRSCYKEKHLMNDHPDGYMLCEIEPPIIGQPYGLGGKNMHRIVIASRHSGYSIFTINDWPIYVHVARLIRSISDNKFAIKSNDIESIGWAEVYESATAAKTSFVSR